MPRRAHPGIILLVVLLCLAPGVQAQDGVATDKAALTALYNATDGANWTPNTNWTTDEPLSSWHGVTTNSDGRVTALALNNNGLDGTLPAELGDLSALEQLDLQNNALSGALPDELANLTNLTSLLFNESRALTGPLPDGLRELSGLETVNIEKTELCAPDGDAFQTWLDTITFSGLICPPAEQSVIDVAVFYTSAARENAGGTDVIATSIDLMVAETNAAYEASGANQRIKLVAVEEVVGYTEANDSEIELIRLQSPSDGHMDEVHDIRDAVAADIVLLIPAGLTGWAFQMFVPSTSSESRAFGVVNAKSTSTFAHELGHIMGLHHDRYAVCGDNCNNFARFPYAFGYVNQRALEPSPPDTAFWRTIMAYRNQCGRCPAILRFSNPDQIYPDPGGDPLGKAGLEPAPGADGPSDAVRMLNRTRGYVANFRPTITDDDPAPVVTLKLTPDAISENGGVSTVTASLDRASSAVTTVTVSAMALDPVVSGDFMLSGNRTLTIPVGQTASTGTVTVRAVNNTVDAPNKTVSVSATADNSQGVTPPAAVTLTITDDDDAPAGTLKLTPDAIGENGGVTTVTASLNRASSAVTTVTVSAMAVDPAVSNDFMLSTNRTLTIPMGQTDSTGTVTVRAVNNTVDAPNKTVTVSATADNSQGVTPPAALTLAIVDDDAAPVLTLAVGPSAIMEAGGSSTVTVRIINGVTFAEDQEIALSFAGTATKGTDYTVVLESLTLTAGQSSVATTVTAVQDRVDDDAETILVTASHGGGTIGAEQTITIIDDDATPAVTTCSGGMAGTYPCSNVDLMSFLALTDIGGGEANDIWGWTDSLTGKEYAIMGRTNGTSFVDISDPVNPIYLGNLPPPAGESTWRDIKVYADHAFIVSEANNSGMQVFDLTQLRMVASPPATFSETAHYPGFSDAHNLAINENSGFAYAVGTNTCSGGLHMINIQTPTNPTSAGCFSGDGHTHDAQCVNYAGPDPDHQGKEICFNSNLDTLTIVDVTNKAGPVMLSRTGYSGSRYAHQGWLTEDQVYFLLGDESDETNNPDVTNTRTYMWDVSDLDDPALIGSHDSTTTAIDHNQYVKGNYTYQSNYHAGLRILDITDIANGNLSEAAFFDVNPGSDATNFEGGTWSNYPFFDSGIVIVSVIEQGLFILRPNLVDGVNPALSSASVNGAALTLTYGEALDESSTPATDDFTVTVAGSGRTVTHVSVSGRVVTLTLASVVAHNETVTVSYSPGANPIRDAAGNGAIGLSNEPVANETPDTTAPRVMSITSEATHPTKDRFTVTIIFTEEVTGLTAGEIVVINGLGSNFAGAGATYMLDIEPSANIEDDVTVRVPADAAVDGANIGNVEGSETFAVDTRTPTVSTVEISSDPETNRTYAAEDEIEVTVTFSETVEVTGTPQLRLELGGGRRTAAYEGGSGTAALVFGYEVAEGESDTDGVGVEADSLAGGTIRDEARNNAELDHDGLAADSGHKVDGVRPQLAASGGAVVNGTRLTLTYDEALDGGSRPVSGDFTVRVEGARRSVANVAVSGRELELTLDPAAEHGEAGITVSYTPGTSPIRDVPGNEAEGLSRESVTNETPDTTSPEVSSLVISSNPGSVQTYAAGEVIELTVRFSETVVVTGTLRLRLRVGSRNRTAGYLRGTDTAALVFGYEVADGDEDTDGVSMEANSLTRNVGTIRDGADNNALLSHDGLAADASHKVDGVRPVFQSAAVEGASLTLTYGEALDGGSRPAPGDFTVEVGGAGRTVSGVSVSGSVVTLTLNPAVEHGDTGIRVSYTPGTNPLRDAVGNDALGLSNEPVTNTTGAPNTAPEITSPSSFEVPENQALVRRLEARDIDPGDEVTGWEIVSGADQGQFTITSDTGHLSFQTAPDYEDPRDTASSDPVSGAGDNEYVVRVEVRSGTGARELEAEQTFTVRVTDEREPPGVPEAPTFSGETAESMTVNWSEPDNTGPPITDYDVQYREKGTGRFTDGVHEGPGFSLTLDDLEPGTAYEVQVRATNDEGASDWSESGEGRTITPLTVQMTPSPPPPVEGAFSLRFSFSEEVRGFTSGDIETQQEPACTDSANNPISCNPTIAALQTTDNRIFTTTVNPRTERVAHNYTLTITVPADRVTSSPDNKPNEATTLDVRIAPPGVTVPISSLGRTASPGNGQVTLRWNAPQNTGGSAIIRYEYRWRESVAEFGDWVSVGPAERSATVPNLTNGREYVFEVRGVNALGYGPVETASATPESGGGGGGGGGGGFPQPPRPPANNRPMADAGPDQAGVREGALVTLDGSGSSDPDDDPLKYRWNQYRGERVALSSRDVVNPTFTAPQELTADVVLSFRLLVTDPGGRFDTDTVKVTVTVTDEDNENPGKPLAPTVSAATPYSLMVEWMEPENSGPAITDYDVQYREGGSGDSFTDAQHQGTARTATLTGLMPDTVYEVQVRATNVTGTGDWSESGEGKTKTLQTGDQIYYFPHLAVGASWQTTITYINYSREEVTCQTDFLSDHGTPLMVSFAELGTVDSRTDVLPPGGSVHQETDVDLSAPLAPGWALANCSGPLKASLLYRQHNSEGVPTAEAGVNATAVPATRFVTFAEQGEGQFGTGVAYANPSATAALVTFTARDTAGEVLASVDRELSPGGHDAHGMSELFDLTSFTGSIEVTSTEPIVSLSLNFEADPVFSSLPPGELDVSAQGSTTYYFPHLAVGASWQTTITYINYSPEEVACQTDFISDHGTPLLVSFAALGTVVSRTDVLPPGGSVHQETNVDLNASLARGWARATCSGPVKASLLYRRHNSEGAPTGEAGVNATAVPATRFVTFAEQGEGQFGTGVAYANPSAISVPVTFTARDAVGEVLASVVRTLLPGGHDAHGMAELFGLSSFSGSLEVTSTAPIVSLSLNFEAAPVFSSLPPGELDAAAQ